MGDVEEGRLASPQMERPSCVSNEELALVKLTLLWADA